MAPPANSVEGTIIVLVQWWRLAVGTLGAVLVALGVCVAIVQLVRTLAGSKSAHSRRGHEPELRLRDRERASPARGQIVTTDMGWPQPIRSELRSQ